MSEPGPIFCGDCELCGWSGPAVSTMEEAMRDADAHKCDPAVLAERSKREGKK